MKLPNCEQAEVTMRKLTTYLLDIAHPQNKGKAAFYELVGYNQQNTDALKEALLGLVLESEITKVIEFYIIFRFSVIKVFNIFWKYIMINIK